MDNLAMPVTIVVKAPNQQIEDQTILCEPDWTIKRLKGHLSQVYPSKPRLEDQKLIYSGQLLVDTVQLKDVLRTYDGQQNHTVHLVCSPPRERERERDSANRSSSSSSTTSIHRNNSNTVSSSTPTAAAPVASTSSFNNNNNNNNNMNNNISSTSSIGSNNSVRNRFSTTNIHAETEPLLANSRDERRPSSEDPRELWAAAAAAAASAYPNMGSGAGGYNAGGSDMAHQMAWMQQAYSQYMSQYMQFMASSQGASGVNGPTLSNMAYSPYNGFTLPGGLQQQFNDLHQHQYQQQHQQNPAAAPPANNNQQQQAAAADNEDEEGRGGNRDWLDWFYIMSRVLVLFSIVYFYSSPVRFLMVSTLGMIMYLYQVGFFRMQGLEGRNDAAVNANNNGNAAANNLAAAAERENNNDRPNPVAAAAATPNANNNADAAAAGSSQPQPDLDATLPPPQPPAEPDRPSFLTLTWTIFCSFLLSLIPEQPNVI